MQARIAEYIRKKNIEENYESAMEFNPEVFASVTMLYVNMDVGTSQTLVECETHLTSVLAKAVSTHVCGYNLMLPCVSTVLYCRLTISV